MSEHQYLNDYDNIEIEIITESGTFYGGYDDLDYTDEGIFIETVNGPRIIYEDEIYEI
jgi:hypothetical protein